MRSDEPKTVWIENGNSTEHSNTLISPKFADQLQNNQI